MSAENEDLIDYEDDDLAIPSAANGNKATAPAAQPATTETKDTKGSYVGIHSASLLSHLCYTLVAHQADQAHRYRPASEISFSSPNCSEPFQISVSSILPRVCYLCFLVKRPSI